jgi:hypothetical protein
MRIVEILAKISRDSYQLKATFTELSPHDSTSQDLQLAACSKVITNKVRLLFILFKSKKKETRIAL